jgi:hypothetical protein
MSKARQGMIIAQRDLSSKRDIAWIHDAREEEARTTEFFPANSRPQSIHK